MILHGVRTSLGWTGEEEIERLLVLILVCLVDGCLSHKSIISSIMTFIVATAGSCHLDNFIKSEMISSMLKEIVVAATCLASATIVSQICYKDI